MLKSTAALRDEGFHLPEGVAAAPSVSRSAEEKAPPRLHWAADRIVLLLLMLTTAVRRYRLGLIDDVFTDWREALFFSTTCITVGVALFAYKPKSQVVNWRSVFAVLLSVAPGFLIYENGSRNPLSVVSIAVDIRIFFDLFLSASILSLGRNFSLFPTLAEVATGGTYRLLRHPIYGSYLHCQLVRTIMDPRFIQFAVLIAYFSGFQIRISEEERLLRRDDRYVEYVDRTRWTITHPVLALPVIGLGLYKVCLLLG